MFLVILLVLFRRFSICQRHITIDSLVGSPCILLIPPLLLHHLLIIIILLLLLPIFPHLPLLQEVWKASRLPFSPARHWDVCIQVWPPPPTRFTNNDRFEIIHKLQNCITRHWFSDICHPEKTGRTYIKTERKN